MILDSVYLNIYNLYMITYIQLSWLVHVVGIGMVARIDLFKPISGSSRCHVDAKLLQMGMRTLIKMGVNVDPNQSS